MARSTVPAKVLNRLLQDCATHTAECKLCRLGPVVEIPVDEIGCDWKVSRFEGSHCGECLIAMHDFVAALREQFTLLTTWAMR